MAVGKDFSFTGFEVAEFGVGDAVGVGNRVVVDFLKLQVVSDLDAAGLG